MRAHAAQLGVDPKRIAAGGGSAGGHLAAATATLKVPDDESAQERATSSRPDALVLFNPVFDNGPGGYGHERVKERYREISPIHNLDGPVPPTLVFLGARDRLVPVATAERWRDLMKASGQRCDLLVYDGQGHGFFNHRKGKNPYYAPTVEAMDAFLAELGFLPSTANPTHAKIAERCQAELDAVFEAGVFPGASVGIVLPDGHELSLVVGLADRDLETRMTPEHRMLSGSVGKVYVSAAAHHLAQSGALDLDARAASFFADDEEWLDRVPNARDVTIRQLLRHQSGIPRYVFDPAFWKAMLTAPEKHWAPHELLAYVFDAEPLFAPGEGWSYADTNFIVVGMVLEQVSKVPFYDYVQKHLLRPHGLSDTVPSNTRKIERLVQGHVVASRSFGVGERTLDEHGVVTFNPQFEWCGGGWASTPLDLARFARILYSGRAFEGPYLESMLETVAKHTRLGPGRRYGLGVITTPTDRGTLYGHDGFMPGYVTAMGYLPDVEVAVAISVNTDDARSVGRPLPQVLDQLVALAAEELAR